MTIRGWVSDLAVGVRLAVGGGRTAMARLVLSSLGIAIASAVLLVAASVGTMHDNRTDRTSAAPRLEPVAGVTPTYYMRVGTEFHGEKVLISYVWSTGPNTPKPAGLPTLPKPGEMYASPALGELLRSTDGELLRPRLPEKIIGTLDKGMVIRPGYLTAWVGADETLADSSYADKVYGFDDHRQAGNSDAGMLTLLLIGAVALLMPVFTFITSASRIAGAERDRRLSALRLVGAGAWQVRRIAAAESLVSAVVGLAAGGTMFAVARLYADDVNLFGESVYTSDVVPDPVLAVLMVLLVPALSVLTALFALRRTIIEPLGVVRQSKPVRRRAWWRFALVVLGVVLMTTQLGAARGTDLWAYLVTAGAALLLIGMLVLLPWLVERVSNRISGGPPSWVLAVRRLQLDSGTSARVVGGVAVVLAGMIAMQTILLSIDGALAMPGRENNEPGIVEVTAAPAQAVEIQQNLTNTEAVLSAPRVQSTFAYQPNTNDTSYSLSIVDCAALKELGGVKNCQDGDVFQEQDNYQSLPKPGTALEFRDFKGKDWDPEEYEVTSAWTMPANVKTIKLSYHSPLYGGLYATPGALAGAVINDNITVIAKIDKNVTPDQLEGVRNAVADQRWRSYMFSYNTAPELNANQQTYASIRTALYAGSVFTLILAGVSLLVLALEHIRERRRPLAVLAASGVPKAVLGRSLLWQVAIPIALGVVMALLTGIGLAALMMRLAEETLNIDWPGIILLCVGAALLSLLVSTMTLPFLNRATRLTTLRTE